MAGMAEDDMGSLIDQSVAEGDMISPGAVTPIRPPVGRNDEKVDLFLGITDDFKECLRAIILPINGNIKDTWSLIGSLPVRFVICKGDQSNLYSVSLK